LKPYYKYLLLILLSNILLLIAVYYIISYFKIAFLITEIAFLSGAFSAISVLTVFIFLRGRTQDPDSQTLHSLMSIGLKFLLEMILALVWFILLKKNSMSSVFIFFILYLSLSLISIGFILKTLKNKVLQNQH
jgi:hypothetical protein